MKRLCLPLLVCCALLLSGCAAPNPLAQSEATDVPGLSMELHPAAASEDNVMHRSVALYYRYLDEPMLACETRALTVRRDKSDELAIIEALLEGPSAGHSDLVRLIPSDTVVVDVSVSDGILFVTFNEAFLKGDARTDQGEDAADDAPMLRRLTAQSVVATLTEFAPYRGVQLLVSRSDGSSARLKQSYFLQDGDGAVDPLSRDETLLLTPQNTAERVLQAWQSRDAESLRRYLMTADQHALTDLTATLDTAQALIAHTASAGSVSEDGNRAVVTLSLTTQDATVTYPLPLLRENGVWKLSYAALLALLQSGGDRS